MIEALEHAVLRGLGGAGFPAGRKWRIVREQAAPRLLAVNIDEGEPGTFKDRWYLERDPHRLLEGVLVAARVVGCEAVYLYLRDEYHHGRRLLQRALAELQANPPCDLPRIELRRGAGAYICGEESAMVESIEGQRGLPRLRPPYIAQKGLFGRPTLQQNFETLYWVRDIVEKGGDWFASHGRHGRQGLRSFSVSGRVKQPGVKLAPAGITLRELIDEFCGGMAEGHTLYAYLPGGASGGILPARLADVPLDFDTLQPHGCFIGSAAVVVLSQHDSAREAALNQMRFFAHESCGQCTPCRTGTDKAAQLMARDAMGRGHAARPGHRDGRCVHLRPGSGRAESAALRDRVLPARDRSWPFGGERVNARLPNVHWPEGVRRHGTHTPATGEATVAFTLDGQPALAREGESILHAARRHGVAIPQLCHSDGLRPDGNCRACVVEVDGERVLAASCCRAVTPGMDGQGAKPARAAKVSKWCWSCWPPTCRIPSRPAN